MQLSRITVGLCHLMITAGCSTVNAERNGSSHEPTFETSLTSNLGSVALAGAEVAEEGSGALAPFLVYIVTTAPKHSPKRL